MKSIVFSFTIITLFFFNNLAIGASFEKAVMLNQHGLVSESKLELINIIFSKASDSNKAKAYYLLGSLAFEGNKMNVSLDTWKELMRLYPNSNEAQLVRDNIKDLGEIVSDLGKESIKNAVAQIYLRNADFWSKDKDDIFRIDSSWISEIEASIKWYDRVIKEFPNSKASRIAYEDKMRTLLGWKELGRDGNSYGIRYRFNLYMPQLLDTFYAFENEFPEAAALQSFRYQIAQAYWKHKDWDETKQWLNLIIEKAGNGESFYKDLAVRRLKKVEY